MLPCMIRPPVFERTFAEYDPADPVGHEAGEVVADPPVECRRIPSSAHAQAI
jgi:hypothetical protein